VMILLYYYRDIVVIYVNFRYNYVLENYHCYLYYIRVKLAIIRYPQWWYYLSDHKTIMLLNYWQELMDLPYTGWTIEIDKKHNRFC